MVAHPGFSHSGAGHCRPLPGFSQAGSEESMIFLGKLSSCPIRLWALAQIGQWFFGPVSPCVMLMKWRWVKGRPKTHPERCLEGSNLATCINMYQHHSKCINMYSINIHTTSITTIFWSSPWCYRWLLTHPNPTHGHRSVALDARPQGIDGKWRFPWWLCSTLFNGVSAPNYGHMTYTENDINWTKYEISKKFLMRYNKIL